MSGTTTTTPTTILDRCIGQVHWTGVLAHQLRHDLQTDNTSTVQVYWTGVLDRCTRQVYWTGVLAHQYRHDLQTDNTFTV